MGFSGEEVDSSSAAAIAAVSSVGYWARALTADSSGEVSDERAFRTSEDWPTAIWARSWRMRAGRAFSGEREEAS